MPRRAPPKPVTPTRQFRVNERIRAREIRVIGENGEQLGVMPLTQALQLAREAGADLVEVAPTAAPPVCRMLDYGKFKYEQAKKDREARKHQKTVEVRQVRFRPKIDAHDREFKTNTVRKLLEHGDKVKLLVLFRGREITHADRGKDLLNAVVDSLRGAAVVDRAAAMEGRSMTMILAPAKQGAAKVRKEKPADAQDQDAQGG